MDNDAPVTKRKRYRKRGRFNSEDFRVIEGGFSASGKRPDPPSDLTEGQAGIWREIVASEPPDFFASSATQLLLTHACYHADAIRMLNKEFSNFRSEWLKSAEGMKTYNAYLKARGEETRRFSLIATRLRLTNQSRYTPQAAATASRNTAKVRPWEEE